MLCCRVFGAYFLVFHALFLSVCWAPFSKLLITYRARKLFYVHNTKQLLDEVEQNIVICQWRADQLFASAFGIGK